LRAGQHYDSDPADFSEEDNTGIVLGEASGGLVDVDLDQPEAVIAARNVLPPGVVFGRRSSPGSHHLYAVMDPGATVRLRGSAK
jgi:hypothetical protein